MDTIKYDPEATKPCWLAYFDLLGTSSLISSGKTSDVFNAYLVALGHLESWDIRHPNVFRAWFSDTFIMYTEDDSRDSFKAIEIISRWFMFALLDRKIPVRGALACNHFYADRSNSLYLGEALLDAYECGENQDWIGYIICPSAISKLSKFEAIRELQNYTNYEIPFKKPPKLSKNILACKLGDMIRDSDDRNFLIDKLIEMKKNINDPSIQKKYTRTIDFLMKFECSQDPEKSLTR